MPQLDTGPDPEWQDLLLRLKIGAPLTAILFVLEMGSHLGIAPIAGWVHELGAERWGWIQWLLATPVVCWVGGAVLCPRLEFDSQSQTQHVDVDQRGIRLRVSVLVSWPCVFPGVIPDSYLDAHARAPLYFEAAAVILILVLVGQLLELRARARTGDAIKSLLRLAPQTAERVQMSSTDVSLDAEIESDNRRDADGTARRGTPR